MLYHIFNIISSSSIIIPLLASLFWRKNKVTIFQPFMLLLWVGLLSEVIGWYFILVYKNNLVVANIYVLIESLILIVQFSFWDNRKNNSRKYIILGFLFLIVWALDNFVLHKIITVNSLFRVFYSLVIVFLSIEQINFVFVTERNNVLTNARFILSGAFVIFFTYKAVFEVFYMIDVRMSDGFYYALFKILLSVNLFTNLIFAFAVICIPKKQKFTLPF